MKRLPKWINGYFNVGMFGMSREAALQKALRIAWKALDEIAWETNASPLRDSVIARQSLSRISKLGGKEGR